MRLIDADKLIEELNKNSIFRTVTNAEGKSAIEIIEEQQTAFDVDKVVKQLEELRDKANLDMLKNMNEPIPYSSTSNRMFAYDKAIEIVKAGGRDD